MNATCPHCGKVLKSKPEWAGKTLKCPQCGQAFKPGGAVSPAQAIANLSKPKTAGPAQPRTPTPPVRAPRAEQKPGIALNWGPILALGGLAALVLGVLLVVFGPIRVKGQWDAVKDQAEGDVTSVVEAALKGYASQSGAWNPNKAGGMPSVLEVNFSPGLLAMSLPDVVPFNGTGTIGRFEGELTRSTRTVAGTLTTGGVSLGGVYIDAAGASFGGQTSKGPAGLPMRGGANQTFQLTGRIGNNDAATAELDGRKMDIYYPPQTDEDGNPIVDDDAAARSDANAKFDAARRAGNGARR